MPSSTLPHSDSVRVAAHNDPRGREASGERSHHGGHPPAFESRLWIGRVWHQGFSPEFIFLVPGRIRVVLQWYYDVSVVYEARVASVISRRTFKMYRLYLLGAYVCVMV